MSQQLEDLLVVMKRLLDMNDVEVIAEQVIPANGVLMDMNTMTCTWGKKTLFISIAEMIANPEAVLAAQAQAPAIASEEERSE